MKTSIAVIVAMDEENGIGIKNKLPWHLPSEMAYFMRTTKHHVVIMGRKSYDAIGEPLKDRYNIVLSNDINFEREGVLVASSIEEALFFAKLILIQDGAGYEDDYIFIMGGGNVYHQAIQSGIITHLFLTRIHAKFECDTFFPEIDLQNWKEVKNEFHPANENNPYDYTVFIYEKIG